MNTSVLSGSIRELSLEEIELVSGAFSVSDMYATMFGAAVAGAVGGFAVGGLVGAGAGALGASAGAGAGYLAYHAWMYCFG